ncbi:MAG: DUF2608 domain-containing protein [Puniceicoccales bacterium]|jgi:hypothetical protein|nr:DUF2608 domain-containing protein [Puniceicoccales bacterium]
MRISYKFFRILIVVSYLSAFASVSKCGAVESKILRADDIDAIKAELSYVDGNTLVVFDCDDVLTTVEDAVLKKENRHFIREWYDAGDRELSFLDLMCRMVMLGKNCTVNVRMPKLVRNLQNKNVRALVLTGFSAKPFTFGDIRDPRHWRSKVLNGLGYHFENSWPEMEDKHFDEFGDPYDPSFSSGIICTGDVSKAESLKAFLDYVQFWPTAIIFVDDNEKNLTDVSALAKSKNIHFIGIHYTEASKMASKFPFSKKRARLQLDTLVKENCWLSDRKAEEVLRKK